MIRRFFDYYIRGRRFALQRDRSGFVATEPDERGRFELAFTPRRALTFRTAKAAGAFKGDHRAALRGGWRVTNLKG
jgi:hypothetical protein